MVLLLSLLQRYEFMFSVAIPVNTDKFKERKVVVSGFGNLEYLLKSVLCSRDYVLNIGRTNFNWQRLLCNLCFLRVSYY